MELSSFSTHLGYLVFYWLIPRLLPMFFYCCTSMSIFIHAYLCTWTRVSLELVFDSRRCTYPYWTNRFYFQNECYWLHPKIVHQGFCFPEPATILNIIWSFANMINMQCSHCYFYLHFCDYYWSWFPFCIFNGVCVYKLPIHILSQFFVVSLFFFSLF